MTVYVLDPWYPKAIARARKLFSKVILHTDPDFAGWQQKARAILVRGSSITAFDVAKCPNLVAIGKHGVGIEKIDQAACAERNIKILNTPGANAQAVAEVVVALALSVARNIPAIYTRQVAGGEAVHKQTCSGLTLHRKTVGVVGMGNIGRCVARILQRGFDAEIVAYDPYMPASASTDGPWSEIPHRRVDSVAEMLGIVDVLTVHVPLTAETRDMIAYQELCSMKSTAIVLNGSRGGIVNEDDLERALREGKIWGAGLDAHEQEPPTRERYGKLWELPNVVSTPHIGAATEDAQLASAIGAVDNLYNYLVTL
ncbi:D-3-phosphoglycerate dehydrogenase [Microdochium trichocladiopsis]|uniref:D-3-phosphoglycerate dehydrogenase n=1 Tax=Microdochium trichocladiopsis TaxID=1682393 RepID=A0A9P8XZK9_9PEZI|nr:D-3-phosphoglycerate dehydrogenase [Microdochium trichocladiopsis]KAH7024553.1 D-3-phosphoglycerate dehydrogenase [Microdochium trichocladiopsis]